MLNMLQVNYIKELYSQGQSISQISREAKVDRKTVRKWLNVTDFSPRIPQVKTRPSILDPFHDLIFKWLEDDRKQKMSRKQSHTIMRIWKRLKNEQGFKGSYSTVRRFVVKLRTRLNESDCHTGTLELVWDPGSTQADYGEADFVVDGQKTRLKYFILSFPFSNIPFTQVYYGENAECVCQELQNIFEFLGGVPPVIVFDNATGVGRRTGKDVRETELFKRFRMHYRFEVRFCNPRAGYEKGNVERKVAFIRKNIFVPINEITDFKAYNQSLLERFREMATEVHYKKRERCMDLFQKDKKALLPLPETPFNVVQYEMVKADGYGKICLDGKHYYGARPEDSHKKILAGKWADHIDLLDENGTLLATYPRRYGQERTDDCDPLLTLPALIQNPGAWKNSALRKEFPKEAQDYIDRLSPHEKRKLLQEMEGTVKQHDLHTGTSSAMEHVREKVLQDLNDPDEPMGRAVDTMNSMIPTHMNAYDMLMPNGGTLR